MAMFQNPGEEDYAALLAENAFVHDVQIAIETAMDAGGISQAALAKLMGVSEARVSHILSSNGRNLQARSIARIAHVLGLRALIDFVEEPSGWIGVDIEGGDAKLVGHETFADWMAAAYNVLERPGLTNDNSWATPPTGQDTDIPVAA